jgi:hypothetical protein
MPTAAAEAALAKRGVSIARRVFQNRKSLRQERLDLEALLSEVTHNLEAVRALWSDSGFNRWAHRAMALETTVWRQRAYPLTMLTGGRLISRDLAAELDDLARDFERAQRQTYFDPQWEPRLAVVAEALRNLLAHHPRRPWNRLFLRRLGPSSLPTISTETRIPQTIGELQRQRAPRAEVTDAEVRLTTDADRKG